MFYALNEMILIFGPFDQFNFSDIISDRVYEVSQSAGPLGCDPSALFISTLQYKYAYRCYHVCS